MSLSFEWDREKARTNSAKHGISFEEASTVFGDPLAVTIPDPDHSQEEQRSLILGLSRENRLLVVTFVERRDAIRIISARRATPRERSDYEEGE